MYAKESPSFSLSLPYFRVIFILFSCFENAATPVRCVNSHFYTINEHSTLLNKTLLLVELLLSGLVLLHSEYTAHTVLYAGKYTIIGCFSQVPLNNDQKGHVLSNTHCTNGICSPSPAIHGHSFIYCSPFCLCIYSMNLDYVRYDTCDCH